MKAPSYAVDTYVLDTLMADLVGHDRRPSAFLVYLAILAGVRSVHPISGHLLLR